MLNVLLTCAGRRNYLVDYFRQALAGRGEVLAADASPDAPALQEADRALLVPPVSDPDYVDALHRVCKRHRVGLLVPLNDFELPVLARHRQRFLETGTVPLIASPRVVDLCFDKLATFEHLRGLGVSVPRTFATLEEAKRALVDGELSFPVVVKPRWGTASIGIDYAGSFAELEFAWQLGALRLARSALASVGSADPEGALIVQERLRGEEHALDVVNDLFGNHVVTFTKRKLVMRAGETDRAVTVDLPSLRALGRRLGEELRHIGNLDCDVFVDGERASVLEINPRFGGGYPFSHAAGANLPAALIAWALGEVPAPAWLEAAPGIGSAKCDRLVRIGAAESRARLAVGAESASASPTLASRGWESPAPLSS